MKADRRAGSADSFANTGSIAEEYSMTSKH